MKNLVLSIVVISGLLMSCSFDALFGPDDEGSGDSDRRGRRSPDDHHPPHATTALYVPLASGISWSYAVEYRQTSRQNDANSVAYSGEETWNCSLARFSDSTFVFQTRFSGQKIVSHAGGVEITDIVRAEASVSAQIVKGALILNAEQSSDTGGELAPFCGDWLFRMGSYYKISFSSTETYIEQMRSADDLQFNYKLKKNSGLVSGSLTARTAYELITIHYVSSRLNKNDQ